MKACTIFLFIFALSIFLFWYGGLDFFQRNAANAWAAMFSLWFSVAATCLIKAMEVLK